jgi:hypothetical protein
MRTRCPRRSAARALLALALGWGAAAAWPPAVAHAQEQSGPVGLVVDLDPQLRIDSARIRDAIAQELGAAVTFDRDAPGGTVHVQQEGPRVVVWFDSPSGHHEGRSFELPPDPEQAVRDIALLAVNVARDQASAFVVPTAPPPGPDAAPRAGARARGAACVAAGPRLPIGLDFAPFVGISSSPGWRSSTRIVSLGAIGTLSGGVDGVAAAGVANIEEESLCGGAFAGVANVVGGPVHGGEVAGVLNVSAGPVRGAQIAGVINLATAATGGAQIAGVANVTGGTVTGAEVSGVLNTAAEVRGAQIGSVNVATGAVHGVQIGVVNVAETADFSLGVVNVLYKGRLNLDLWALPEAGLLFAAVKNGGAHYHYIYGMGLRATDTHPVWLTFGLGAHVVPGGPVFFDVDVLAHGELAFVSNNRNDLYEARVVVGYRLLPGVSAFAGPTFNVLNAWNDAPTGVAPPYSKHLADTTNSRFEAWPGVALGIEGL